MDDIIDEFYEKLNFPGLEKLFKAISAKHKDIKKSDVKTFLDKQIETQILKKETKTQKPSGHIIALAPNETWQCDFFEFLSYGKQNAGHLHIFAVIDVFTRKAYCVPTKKKDAPSATEALKRIINEADAAPNELMCDNDSAFASSEFQKVIDEFHIIYQPNVLEDHHALGLIDAFAKRLRQAIAKKFIRTKGTNWFDYLQQIVDNYNAAPNASIEDIAPDDAATEKNKTSIFELNLLKNTKNNTISDLKVGDHVRIRTKSLFRKGSDAQWSDHVYEVIKVKGGNIELNDNEVKKRGNLLKVVAPLGELENVVKAAKIDAKIDKALKSEGLARNDDPAQVFESVKGRERKKKKIFDA